MRTPYGPACVACTPYFKAPEPCEACGTRSRWLSRRKELGHGLRLCPRCARAESHGACEACRRYRVLGPAPDGRTLCKACRERGEIPCPECGRPMPAGSGTRCWACYWRQLAQHRIRISSAGLASPALAKRFTEFGAWLIENTGGHKTALSVHRHLGFFQEIERKWNDVPAYAELLAFFGAAGLRRHLLARRWMEETGLIAVDAAAREADSDRRRIEATRSRLPAGSFARRDPRGVPGRVGRARGRGQAPAALDAARVDGRGRAARGRRGAAAPAARPEYARRVPSRDAGLGCGPEWLHQPPALGSRLRVGDAEGARVAAGPGPGAASAVAPRDARRDATTEHRRRPALDTAGPAVLPRPAGQRRQESGRQRCDERRRWDRCGGQGAKVLDPTAR